MAYAEGAKISHVYENKIFGSKSTLLFWPIPRALLGWGDRIAQRMRAGLWKQRTGVQISQPPLKEKENSTNQRRKTLQTYTEGATGDREGRKTLRRNPRGGAT